MMTGCLLRGEQDRGEQDRREVGGLKQINLYMLKFSLTQETSA